MIANLPLLFANGNPTALSKISAKELERFITFMVTCSWGHDTVRDIRQPSWWPLDVPFSHPFKRPSQVPTDWEERLKHLVRRCYDYHKSAFLLVFSAQLSRYPRKRLRYVDNRDHTTSLYYTPSGKLLVTFRNENIFYDKLDDSVLDLSDDDVKATDIYLCDHCDSHFDNVDTLHSHERLCAEGYTALGAATDLKSFLNALKLQPVYNEQSDTPQEVTPNRTRQVRSAASLDRGPPYPFSSLAGLRSSKSNSHRDSNFSRERVERYCCTLPLLAKHKLGTFGKTPSFPTRYRRPIDYWNRRHVFTKQRNKEVLDLTGQLLLLKCRPVKVPVERMSMESMQNYMENLKQLALEKAKQSVSEEDIEFVSEDILACDGEFKVSDPFGSPEDVIDLCSDDESSSVNENCDPKVGITCVVRGGAVLRRTAATPHALPAEPCGARERPHADAILQPHPVMLFTSSLNNIISID